MSDHALVLVAVVESPSEVAARILEALTKDGIIEAMPTDSALGGLAHRPGPGVLKAVENVGEGYSDFRELQVNGLELALPPRTELFTSGDEMPTLSCPACGVAMDEERGMELAHQPFNPFVGLPTAMCERCNKESSLLAWKLENGAFGNLALHFWNWWPLQDAFIERLNKLTGSPLTAVDLHI